MRKNLISIISVLILFSSCNKEINRKDFFYDIEEFSNPKVLVYEHREPFDTSKHYYIVEKIDHKKLKIKIISQGFGLFQILTYEFQDHGILINESEHYWPDLKKTNEEVLLPTIFSFNSDTVAHYKTSYIDRYTTEKVIQESYWIFKSYRENSGKLEMLTEGVTSRKRIYRDSINRVEELQTSIIYTQGIGLTQITYDWETGQSRTKYIETITMDEFEKLQVTY